ncbi:MAG: SPOR domain-containing protein [Rhodospirillales bacterium]|nr:SPOR domain-containing protein [Rhodospirillales bacterium]
MTDRIRPEEPEEIGRIVAGSGHRPPEDVRLDVPLSSGLPAGRGEERPEEAELRRPLLSPGAAETAEVYDGPRLDRFFEPLRGEAFQAGEEAPSRRRLLFPSIIVLVALLGFVGVLLYGMNAEGPRQGMLEPPTLKAQIDVDKIKPDEPGGLQVLNRDVEVLNQADSGNVPEIVVLKPAAEEPVPLPEPGPEPGKAGPLDVLPERSPVSITENDAVVPPDRLAVPALGVPRRPTAKLQGREDEILAELMAAKDGKPARHQTATAVPVAALPPTPAAAAGPYLIQLASMQTAEAAEDAWGRISRSYSAQLADLAHSIQRAEISGSGFRFRVRVGSFPTRTAAQTQCDRLKAAGQACIVVTP